MKDFVKMTLAVVCGIAVTCIIGFFFFFAALGSMIAAGTAAKTVVPSTGVLVLDLQEVSIGEQTQAYNPFASTSAGLSFGQTIPVLGIWDAVQAINAAAADPGIKYIYLRPEGMNTSLANAEELRAALAAFRAGGKPVISYMTNISTGAYYLASVSDKIYSSSYGGASNTFFGMSGSMLFVKDLLDKLGINVQLIRHGKYKSAGEMYVRNSPSPENMEQNREMVRSMWESCSKAICAARELPQDRLDALIDNLGLVESEDFLAEGLVDALYTREELKDRLAVLAQETSFKKVKFIPIADYAAARVTVSPKAGKEVAVVYADGEIVEGTDFRQIAGERFAGILSDLREDDAVKAVVLRVNSPGGSVLASERIKAEIDLLKAVKPVIASYGGYAASGGYWISSGCNKVYSDATTLTGSIGVFSMIPDLSGTASKLAHVNMVPVNSHKHSDVLSLMRPLDAAETARMQAGVEKIYDRFVDIVAQGRSMDSSAVDAIAQGRVWTGADALKIGLVDEIGTLQDAVWYAALSATSERQDFDKAQWRVVGYPKPLTALEMMMEMFGTVKSGNLLAGTPAEDFGAAMLRWHKSWDRGESQKLFARMPYNFVLSY